MNGGFLVQPLPCVRAVVDLLFLFQVLVAVLRPGCPPLFSILPVIPVVGRNGDFLPEVFRSLAFPDPRFLLPVFVKLRDAILRSVLPVFWIIGGERRVKYGSPFRVSGVGKYGFRFRLPLLILIEAAYRQHDVCVGVAVVFVVKRPVGDHAFRNEVLLNVIPDAFDLLGTSHLNRKSDFHFPGKLSVRSPFCFLHFVPENLTVPECWRYMLRKQDFAHDDTAFPGEVIQHSGFIIQQLFTGTVCSGRYRRPAG